MDNNCCVSIERVLLLKNKQNTDKIYPIFELPRTLTKILNSSEQKITNTIEAKIFLLTKIKEVISIKNGQDKERFIELINNYVSSWIASREINRISFHNGCSIKKDCSSIWLPQLNNLEVANPDQLKKNWENNWFRYADNFDLIDSPDGFFVEIPFFPKKSFKTPIEKNKKPSLKSNGFGEGARVSEFLRAISSFQKEIDRIASFYTKMNFDDISGWKVQGGLPSLGKRR